MISDSAVIGYPSASNWSRPSISIHLCNNISRRSIRLSKGGPEGNDDDLVLTPGGFRRRDQVRGVKPGESIRQNEDGTFTVIPNSSPPISSDNDKKKPKNK